MTGLEPLVKAVEAQMPVLAHRLCPRRWRHGDRWPSPRQIAVVATQYLGWRQRLDDEETERIPQQHAASGYYALAQLAAHGVPTWFVAPRLLEALGQTELPPMTYRDLRWPREAMLFVLPRGAVHTPHGEVLWVTVGHIHPDVPLSLTNEPNEPALRPRLEWLASLMIVRRTGAAAAAHPTRVETWAHPVNDDPIRSAPDDPVTGFCAEGGLAALAVPQPAPYAVALRRGQESPQ